MTLHLRPLWRMPLRDHRWFGVRTSIQTQRIHLMHCPVQSIRQLCSYMFGKSAARRKSSSLVMMPLSAYEKPQIDFFHNFPLQFDENCRWIDKTYKHPNTKQYDTMFIGLKFWQLTECEWMSEWVILAPKRRRRPQFDYEGTHLFIRGSPCAMVVCACFSGEISEFLFMMRWFCDIWATRCRLSLNRRRVHSHSFISCSVIHWQSK